MAETTFHSITLPGANPARVPLTAVEFSTPTTYKVRDYCTYQGKLYICSTAHAAGAWNATHFTEVNVGDEINTRLIIPPTTEPASTDRRVGDLWIDTNTESPVISVDPQPVAGSTNVPQSGGTFNLIKNLDNNKAGKSLLTGDFSATSPYSVNDLCIHDGYLYRCIVDIPTGAAWNASKWQATTIETELARIESEEADLDVIAETFGDSNSYAVGDYVLHTTNGADKLYRCTSAVSDTSVWNSQYWSEVKLADEVSDLKSALKLFDIFSISGYEIGGFTGTGLNTEAITRTRSKDYYPIIGGYQYRAIVKTPGKNVKISISWYTANDYVTPRLESTPWVYSDTVYGTAPDDAKYARILIAYADDTIIDSNNILSAVLQQVTNVGTSGVLSMSVHPIVTTADLNDYTEPGAYSFTSIPTTNSPKPNFEIPAFLEVWRWTNGVILQRYTYTMSQAGGYVRIKDVNNVWQPWVSFDSKSNYITAHGTDINTLTDLDVYILANINIVNAPVTNADSLTLVQNYKINTSLMAQTIMYIQRGGAYIRFKNLVGVWSDWVAINELKPNYITTAGTDINTLTDVNVYIAANIELVNAPVTNANSLALVQNYKINSSLFAQSITYIQKGMTYFRFRNTLGVWSDWAIIHEPYLPHSITDNTNFDDLTTEGKYSYGGIDSVNGPGPQRTPFDLHVMKWSNACIVQRVIYPIIGFEAVRFKDLSGKWWDWQIIGGDYYNIEYTYPTISKYTFKNVKNRARTNKVMQDIAVYNGTLFDFFEGEMYVNGSDAIPITNGHGNNLMFGTELHGDFPYLYCPSWIKNNCKIYVNEVTTTSATLVRTISFNTLQGYLNACVDEANNRIYGLLNTSETTYEGIISFIVAALDTGTIISNTSLNYRIPIIQGMKFYDGKIYVSSGDHSAEYPNKIMILDVNGNKLSETSAIHINGEIEGFAIDNGKIYVANQTQIFT